MLKQELSLKLAEYTQYLERTETPKVCKCLWHHAPNTRPRLVEESSECPVHTREGLVLGFLVWVLERSAPLVTWTADLLDSASPDSDGTTIAENLLSELHHELTGKVPEPALETIDIPMHYTGQYEISNEGLKRVNQASEG